MTEDVFERCFADYETVVAAAAYAVGARCQLSGAFLALHVQYGLGLYGKQVLEYKCGLAYARFAA